MKMSEDTTYQNYMRQMDIIRPDETPPITIIGSGASGSGVGIIAGKLGVQNITIYDGDSVEPHNVPNQYYGTEHIGRNKARALMEEIYRLTPGDMRPNVLSIDRFWEEADEIYTPYVFMCVDSLELRGRIMEAVRSNPRVRWVIDTRMAAEYYEVITVDMGNESEIMEFMEGLLGEVREEVCTARSVIYTVMIMAGRAVLHFKKLVKGENVPKVYWEDLAHPIVPAYREWRGSE